MKIRNISLIVILSILLFGCGSSKPAVSNAALDTMMARETFEIEVRAAEPQVTTALARAGNSGLMRPGSTISRVDLTGDGYFIKLEGEKASIELPYYGERQMGGGYGTNGGFTMEDTPVKDLKITKDEKKKSYQVTFNVDNASESLFFTIDVGSSLSSTTMVTSAQRNRIRYTGNLAPLLKTE